MANEVSAGISLSVTKSGLSISGSKSQTLTLSGTNAIANNQTLSTSEEALNFGDCAQIQGLLLVNNDAAITITVGLNNPITQVLSVIPAGGFAFVMGVSTTIYAKSASGTPDLTLIAFEN